MRRMRGISCQPHLLVTELTEPMPIGLRRYFRPDDLPAEIPVFPLSGALLLPRGQLPLNIFEPRYLAMVDAALASEHRLIGVIQPLGDTGRRPVPPLHHIGCVGRLIQWSEVDDGRYLITLTGVARFHIGAETTSATPFRTFAIDASSFAADFSARHGEDQVDRPALIAALKAYLELHELEANWEGIEAACNEVLVNAMAMMSPFGPAEKQLLLEAIDLKTRADTMIAIAERELVRHRGEQTTLQ